MTSLVVVTPARNEAGNIAALAKQLSQSTLSPALWVIVDDGSTDETLFVGESLDLPFPVEVLHRERQGRMITGAAFKAWQEGVDLALSLVPGADLVMKLDADVSLPENYLQLVAREIGGTVGIAGGVIGTLRHREQRVHVPGPVKLYSRPALEALASTPREVGFDVVDEVVVKLAGLEVRVLRDVEFGMRRAIGASQGRLHGRYRNGRVCRWTGYDPLYFSGHVLRYCLRRPFLVGGLAVAWGYMTSGVGPYSSQVRTAHKLEQREKLAGLRRRPLAWLKKMYG